MKRAVYIGLAVLAFLVVGFLYPPPYADVIARAKLSEVLSLTASLRMDLAQLCDDGNLSTAKSLKVVGPSRWIREMAVTQADAGSATLTVITNAIPTDIYFWGVHVRKSVGVPAGSRLVLRMDCPESRSASGWQVVETDVPAVHLPSSLRP